MDAQKGSQSNISRVEILPSGIQKTEHFRLRPEAEPDIICQYGVVVRHTAVAGMELVEFEFLPDAA